MDTQTKKKIYNDPNMEYAFVKREAFNLNRPMKKAIAEFRRSMEIPIYYLLCL
jgi:hypothetical protein